MIKLHLGCGKRYLPGYVHIDMADFPHIDYRQRIEDLSGFADNSVDEIYACHCLEHFDRHQVPAVLAEWARVLKTPSGGLEGGTIRLAVPDFQAAAEHYMEHHNLSIIMGFFVGGQKDKYDYHHYEFDFSHLKELLENAGFSNIKRYDWREWMPENFDDYSRAYLPHMDFENGKLMSLNITAEKKGAGRIASGVPHD